LGSRRGLLTIRPINAWIQASTSLHNTIHDCNGHVSPLQPISTIQSGILNLRYGPEQETIDPQIPQKFAHTIEEEVPKLGPIVTKRVSFANAAEERWPMFGQVEVKTDGDGSEDGVYCSQGRPVEDDEFEDTPYSDEDFMKRHW